MGGGSASPANPAARSVCWLISALRRKCATESGDRRERFRCSRRSSACRTRFPPPDPARRCPGSAARTAPGGAPTGAAGLLPAPELLAPEAVEPSQRLAEGALDLEQPLGEG